MSKVPFTAALPVVLALASPALGLYLQYTREEVGPAKAAAGMPSSDPATAFRHSPLRAYWRESGWDGWGFSHDEVVAAFRGDEAGVNAALTTFAALPGEKVVRLFPGPGSVRSADGKASYPCDWEVRWARDTQRPHGQRKEASETRTAVLTLFVARAGLIPQADPRAARWVRELDDDSFQVRENASRALADLGDAALPVLRNGMGHGPSLEQRRRIRRLLDRLRPIHLARVKFPTGLRVVSLDALMREAEKDWRSGDLGRSWQAAQRFAEWAEYSEDTFPLLVGALRDQREQVRALAEGAFARLGGRGKGALARLEAAAGDALPPGPRDALRKAIQAVAEGDAKAGVEDHWRENRQLRAAIAEHCRLAAKGP